jgi:hypothetical protein
MKVHKTLTKLTFKAGYTSSTLCRIIFGSLVARECRIILNLKSRSSDMMDCCVRMTYIVAQFTEVYLEGYTCSGPERKHTD